MKTQSRISLRALFLAGAMAWATPSGFAQTSAPPAQPDQDHSAPEASQVAPPAPAPTPAPMPSQGGQPGMMGGGMDQMMPMMRAMMAERDGMMLEHVEDRLAALRTELKITDAQIPQWNHFADTLRSATKTMDGVHQRMVQERMPATLPARLDLDEKMLSARLEALRGIKAALGPLYALLSDEQKTLADQSMLSRMSMM